MCLWVGKMKKKKTAFQKSQLKRQDGFKEEKKGSDKSLKF